MPAISELPEQSHEFERVVLLVNNHSTQTRDAHVRMTELLNSQATVSRLLIETREKSQDNIEMLQTTVREGDIVVTVGGDGTNRQAMTALMGTKVPLLPLGGGNGNNLACMLNGPLHHLMPCRVLAEGKVVVIHPILAQMSSELGNRECYAASIMGLGASGEGTARLNNQHYRNRPLYGSKAIRELYEAGTLVRTVLACEEFTITENGIETVLFERAIANGPRVAKYGRFPVQLTEHRLFMTEVRRKRPLQIAHWLGSVLCQPIMNPPAGRYLNAPEAISFTIGDRAVVAHFDAEPEFLRPETEVRISQAEQPFYAISTKL